MIPLVLSVLKALIIVMIIQLIYYLDYEFLCEIINCETFILYYGEQ